MKNWTLKEAVAVINAGTDTEAIKEIVKHFPLVAVIVARKDFDALAAAMPENLTVRKVENELNSGVTETTEADDVEEATEEAGTEESEAGEYENMSKSDLIALCEKRKIKVQKYQKPKQYYIDALNAAKTQDGEEEAEEDEAEEDPVALYKQCKKAGLDVKPKKSAKYYKDALAKAADEAEEEDWDDEEEEEAPAPKKPKKDPAKKEKAAKPAKKAKEEVEEDVEEEDDDDDWDI